ncbi:Small heat shock protein Ibp [Buchnera aphidicola (Neophyllaphis podocarpi)]|uniref:Hsp20 family protein n=1 Tax=Buchnera aphidicola TaxID=9 RepID=UPI0034643D6F
MSYRSFSLIPSFDDNLFSDRFNQIDQMFSRLTGEKPLSESPNYNFIQQSSKNYQLEISVPGFHENEIDISVHNNKLIIKSKKIKESEESKKIKWIHKGISNKNFSFDFSLNHKIKVESAKLELGLLKINFKYEIPEEEKPKKVFIKNNLTNK